MTTGSVSAVQSIDQGGTRMTKKSDSKTATRRKFLLAAGADRRRDGRDAAGVARADRDPEDAGLVARQGRLQRDGAGLRRARQRDGRRPAQDRLSARRRGGASVPGARRRAWRPDRRGPHRARLLVRQAQGGLAVRHRPGVRLQRQRRPRLDPQRRRQGAVRRAPDPDHEGQHQELLRDADADPAARLVQEADHRRRTTSRA